MTEDTGFSTASAETVLSSPLLTTPNSALTKTHFSIINMHSMSGFCKHYVILSNWDKKLNVYQNAQQITIMSEVG